MTMALDDDLAQLRELSDTARELRYSSDTEEADRARLRRDRLVYRLAQEGVSKTRIAYRGGIHRVLVHRIADSYPTRLARWQAEHPGEEL